MDVLPVRICTLTLHTVESPLWVTLTVTVRWISIKWEHPVIMVGILKGYLLKGMVMVHSLHGVVGNGMQRILSLNMPMSTRWSLCMRRTKMVPSRKMRMVILS